MDDKPNELDNQPKVSSPSNRLPEDTKGQINSIVKNDPKIDLLRRTRHKEVMKGNTYHLSTGKYSKQIPKHIIDYLAFIDDLQFDKFEAPRDVVIRLLKANLKRIALAEYREQIENNSLDPQLSKLIRDTYVMAMGVHQTPSLLREETNGIDLSGLTDEQIAALEQFSTALNELVWGSNQEETEAITVIPS
jgi:hypothetical protein